MILSLPQLSMNRRNIFLRIAYDGAGFCGWQRQENGTSIQGLLEEKLALITKEPVAVLGVGRTDAGVHAEAMTANFHTGAAMPAAAFQRALNSMLPKAVRVLEAAEAVPEFHARFSALGKTYRYDFFTGAVQLPAERLYRAHAPCVFSAERARPYLELLVGSHDFSSFEAVGTRDRSKTEGRGAVRTIFRAECLSDPARPEHFSFRFSGDGFLRCMVRNLTGTLIWAGSGKLSCGQFANILAAKDRKQAGPTAPACGLFLEQVLYPPPLPGRPSENSAEPRSCVLAQQEQQPGQADKDMH